MKIRGFELVSSLQMKICCLSVRQLHAAGYDLKVAERASLRQVRLYWSQQELKALYATDRGALSL